MRCRFTVWPLALGLWLLTVACRDETAPQRLASDLSVAFEAPPAVQSGDSAVFQVTIQNVSASPVSIVTGCGPAFEVVVRDQDGTMVWDPLHAGVYASCLSFRVLAPGAALDLQVVWDLRDYAGQPVSAGAFTASAQFDVLVQSDEVTLPAGASRQLVVTQPARAE